MRRWWRLSWRRQLFPQWGRRRRWLFPPVPGIPARAKTPEHRIATRAKVLDWSLASKRRPGAFRAIATAIQAVQASHRRPSLASWRRRRRAAPFEQPTRATPRQARNSCWRGRSAAAHPTPRSARSRRRAAACSAPCPARRRPGDCGPSRSKTRRSSQPVGRRKLPWHRRRRGRWWRDWRGAGRPAFPTPGRAPRSW